jgi:hypothetical protein
MFPHILLADSPVSVHEWLMRPFSLPQQGDVHIWYQHMDPLTAALLIVGGAVFLFAGYKMHRILLAITGAVLGAYLGAGFGQRYGLLWPGMGIGLLLLGVAAWYVTAGSAAILGAIVGALVGAAVWNMSNLDPHYAWSGALTGAVTLGLLSFILFRVSVILFTSLQGSVMLLLGVLGMAYYYQPVRPAIESLTAWHYALPATVMGLMLMGLLFQYMKGPAGSGGSAAAKPAPAKKD